MTNHHLDAIAERIFRTAIRDDRCGELLQCLFEGGSAAVDASGQLILLSAALMDQATDEAGR